jgi:hypothetical protein
MKVANILSDTNLSVSDYFNVVDSMDKIIHGIPTLIIGYEFTDTIFPNFDVTEMCIKHNFYWTFKKRERRDKFEQDMDWFVSKVFSELIENVNYVYLDVIQYPVKTQIKIVKKILSLKKVISYQKGSMVYIYGDNLIFGVDLKLLKYVGFNIDNVKTKIKSISSVFLVGNKIIIDYTTIVESLGNQVKYIPYIYNLLNGQDNIISDIRITEKG